MKIEEREKSLVFIKINNRKKKRVLENTSTLVYNLLRKVVGIEISDCPQCE